MADYDMRNSGSAVDDTVENYLDKRVGGTVNGEVEADDLKSDNVKTDVLLSKDETLSIDITTLLDANIVNLGQNSIPIIDPHVVGRLWNNGGVLNVSAG